MTQPETKSQLSMTPLGWAWLGGFVVVAVVGLFNPWQPDSIELTPVHSNLTSMPGLAVALIMAVVSGVIADTQCRNSGPTRVALVAGLATMTFIVLLLQATAATDAIVQALDFPPERTQSHPVDLAVACSYVAHNHGDSWHVRTTAPGTAQSTDLTIGEGDYGLMQSHPGGHFCVHVTLQQAGAATRIVNGRRLLPDRSVRLCPKAGG